MDDALEPLPELPAEPTVAVGFANLADFAPPRAAPTVPPPSVFLPSDAELRSALLGPRLLFVDDDPGMLEYARATLAHSFVVSLGATTAEDAKRLLREHRPSGVFLSLAFPGAAEIAAELRAIRPEVGIAGVVLSDDEESRATAEAAKADLFLVQPLDQGELSRASVRLESIGDEEPLRVLVHLPRGGSLLDRMALVLESSARFTVSREESLTAVAQRLSREYPHVVLLPGGRSVDPIRALRMSDAGDSPALIVVGGGAKSDALAAGADDVLSSINGVESSILSRALRVRAARRRAPDEASGLLRPHELAFRLRGRLSTARRAGSSLTLAVVEVVDRGALEEAHGALRVERALGSIGRLIQARFGLEDVRARFGGARFVIGAVGSDAAGAAPTCEALQREVGYLSFPGERERFGVQVRIGLASITPSATGIGPAPTGETGEVRAAESIRDLLLHAERRLGSASARGVGVVFQD